MLTFGKENAGRHSLGTIRKIQQKNFVVCVSSETKSESRHSKLSKETRLMPSAGNIYALRLKEEKETFQQRLVELEQWDKRKYVKLFWRMLKQERAIQRHQR